MSMLTHAAEETVADVATAVVGVDTHRDSHTLQMLSPLGAPVAVTTVDNDTAGFAAALEWITAHAGEGTVIAGVEGSRSYGLGLAQALSAAGYRVAEITRVRRSDPRRGKSDTIDAHAIARATAATATSQLAACRADGDREALRILLTARTDVTGQHTQATNRLKDLLRGGDDTDRGVARGELGVTTLTALTHRRGRHDDTRVEATRRDEITRLATTLLDLHTQLTANRKALTEILHDLAPGLTDSPGIGPITAAAATIAWSHPGRVRDDAAFAALAGVCPIEASSGQTTRHRLNRGGDRALNRALHTIAITRWRTCPRTHTYIARRRAEGKTDRDIRRCLKRYIARELHRKLTAAMT